MTGNLAPGRGRFIVGSEEAITRWTLAVLGLLLGVAAPLGALAVRFATIDAVRLDVAGDIAANRFFYLYSLIGTSLVFSAAGFLAGVYAERLRRAETFYQNLAEHDPLTGLYNDRAFQDFYRRAVERAARRREPLSLLMLDVDRLKDINDCFGHLAGNRALIHVAHAIRAAKRAEDAAARWGGDEFAILMELADETAARRVADAILQGLRSEPLAVAGKTIDVTVTIGICAGTDVDEGDDLLAAADQALYRGKADGRDRAAVISRRRTSDIRHEQAEVTRRN